LLACFEYLSYEQVAQYLLQSLSAVKQWVRHYKDEGIDGLKEKQRSGRPKPNKSNSCSWVFFYLG
jgi:transposase